MSDYVAFQEQTIIATGDLLTVALATKERLKRPNETMPLIFEEATGRQIDVDVRGSRADLEKRYAGQRADADTKAKPAGPRKRGRPKLGVVGREVTLLPEHWQWLETQRGGASPTLRRLVTEARRANRAVDRVRQSQDRANRFMSAMAGNLAGFEEATRALYASDRQRFVAETRQWPDDIKATTLRFAEDAFAGP